jgi:WD40 repeat protein
MNTKPLILQGHSRPIKDIKFTSDSELIFTASNDRNVISWLTATGEKQKTFPHSAAVNTMILTKDTTYMITGDNTGCVYFWDIKTGQLLKKLEQDPSFCVRSLDLSSNDFFLMILYAGRMKGSKSFFNVYSLQDIITYEDEASQKAKENQEFFDSFNNEKGGNKGGKNQILLTKPIQQASTCCTIDTSKLNPFKTYECKAKDTKYVQAKFANNNKSVLISREDGYLELINLNNGKILTEHKFHEEIILDFDVNYEKSLILTASRDGYACVINFDTFQVLNRFHPENPTRNLNACKLLVIDNPDYEPQTDFRLVVNSIHDVNKLFENFQKTNELMKIDVDNLFNSTSDTLEGEKTNQSQITKNEKEIVLAVISGGQDSKLVTTTNAKEGGFEIIIYHAIKGGELANFQAHFGPVNTLSCSRNLLASGAEDATVRLIKVENYLFPIDKNK